MSTAYTAIQLRTAIRERIGYDNTTVIGDAELTKMINDVIHDSWDVLCTSSAISTEGPRTGVTAAGTIEYALLDAAGSSIYRLRRLALQLDGYSYPLETFEFGDAVLATTNFAWGPGSLPRYRTKYGQFEFSTDVHIPLVSIIFNPPPDGVYTFEYWWQPVPPVVSEDAHVPFSLLYPVQEYIILECAIRCMRRLRLEASELVADRDRYLQRIEQYNQPEQRERAPRALRTRPIGVRFWR